jgi:hypothetical protein
MSNQKTVTLRWISEATGELVEWPVPAHVAEALARGTRRARPLSRSYPLMSGGG